MAGKYVSRFDVMNFERLGLGTEPFCFGGEVSSRGHTVPIYRLSDNAVPFAIRREVEGDYLLPRD